MARVEKEIPTHGPFLKYIGGASNYLTYAPQYYEYAVSTFGESATILEQILDLQFIDPVVVLPNNNNNAEVTYYYKRLEKVQNEREMHRKQKIKLYSDMMCHVSMESERRMMAHADWDAVLRDPKRLWTLMRICHLISEGDTASNRIAERLKLADLRQNTMPIIDYTTRHNDQYQRVAAIGLQGLPEIDLVLGFLHSLNRLYTSAVVTLISRDEIPATIQLAYGWAIRYAEIVRQSQGKTAPPLKQAGGDRDDPAAGGTSVEKDTRTCFHCQKKGHIANDCKSKAAGKPAVPRTTAEDSKKKKPIIKDSKKVKFKNLKKDGAAATMEELEKQLEDVDVWGLTAAESAPPQTKAQKAPATWFAFVVSKLLLITGVIVKYINSTTVTAYTETRDEVDIFGLSSHVIPAMAINNDATAFDTTRDDWILDSAATANIVCNPAFVESYIDTHQRPRISGIHGHAAEKTDARYVMTKDFGKAIFSESFKCNLISVTQVVKRDKAYKVRIDEDGEWMELFQQANDLTLRFETKPALQMYILQPKEYALLFGDKVDSSNFTKLEILQAKRARVLCRCLDHPGTVVLCKFLDHGSAKNVTLTSADVNRAELLFGPCVGCTKGKLSSKSQLNLNWGSVGVVGEELHMDYFMLPGPRGTKIQHLIAVDKCSDCVTVTHSKFKNQKATEDNMTRHINYYKQFGKIVKKIVTDDEATLKSATNHINSLGVTHETCSPERHVSVVERKIQVVKKHFGATLHDLTYELPKSLYAKLVEHTISSMNLMPDLKKDDTVSPRQQVTGKPFDAKLAVRAYFGQYVFVSIPNQTKSAAVQPKAECGIVVGRDCTRGKVQICLLPQFEIVTRDVIVNTPITPAVIAILNAEAARQNVHYAEGEWIDSPKNNNQADGHIDDGVDLLDDFDNDEDVNIPAVQLGADEDAPIQPPIIAPQEVGGDIEPIIPIENIDPHPPDEVVAPQPVVAPMVVPPPVAIAQPLPPAEPDAGRRVTRSRGVYQERSEPIVPAKFKDNSAAAKHDSDAHALAAIDNWIHYIDEVILRLSLEQAVKQNPTEATKAVNTELEQMENLHVWEALMPADVVKKYKHEKAINSSMFIKFKDTLERIMRARMVAGGHQQEKQLHEDTNSPTACTESVFMTVATAARQGRQLTVLDVHGAFLKAFMKRLQLMKIRGVLAKMLVKRYKHYEKFVDSKGVITVRLLRALYGLQESGKLWYEDLVSTMTEAGFTRVFTERCAFIKTDKDGKNCTVIVHVDDMLVASQSKTLTAELKKTLTAKYGELAEQTGNIINYLGMKMTTCTKTGNINVSQKSYVEKIVEESGVTGSATAPAVATLIHASSGEAVDSTEFLSLLMKLMYIAKRSRPDILFACSFLATKCKQPLESDLDAVLQVYKYLKSTMDLDIVFRRDDDNVLYCYTDAGYMTHVSDTSGHTGVIMKYGFKSAPIMGKSSKQKVITRSSSEAELVALDAGTSYCKWMLSFLTDIGAKPKKTAIVYEDNTQAILMIKNGMPTTNASKHIDRRFFYATSLVKQGIIEVVFLGTKEMLADINTKPLVGSKFCEIRDLVMGVV